MVDPSLAINRRTKEVGVRKILGTSVKNIVLLLSKEYIGLAAIAFLVAVPPAYLLQLSALESGGVIIRQLDVWIFVLAGLFVLAVAWLTASCQAIKAALSSPVDTLRDE